MGTGTGLHVLVVSAHIIVNDSTGVLFGIEVCLPMSGQMVALNEVLMTSNEITFERPFAGVVAEVCIQFVECFGRIGTLVIKVTFDSMKAIEAHCAHCFIIGKGL